MVNQIKKLITCFLIISVLVFPKAVAAESISDLEAQKQAAAAAAESAKARANTKQTEAQFIADQVYYLSREINSAEQSIAATYDQISSTQKKINDLKSRIKVEEEKLELEKEKMNQIVTAWYMEGEDGGLINAFFSSNNISEAITKQEYYDSVRTQIELAQERIEAMKEDLNDQKSDQEKHMLSLQALKEDQVSQQNALVANKSMKDRLLNDTQAAVADLKREQKSAETRIAQLQSRIDALMATSVWGGQIVSSNDSSWYFRQTDYPYTYLGNSPYTVAMYGCLVTSIAMVAKRFGQNITPVSIANVSSNFSYEGYLQVTTPYPVWSVTVLSSQSVSWSVVDRELAAGRPVIASIYLPGVGAINGDGSSHFIVIKSKSNGKYYMHDPLGGGRGYDMNQVRSMKLIVPN